MDSGYNTEEEWAPNPYQAEADAYIQEVLPQIIRARSFTEQDLYSHLQSPADAVSQGKNIHEYPRQFRGPCTRNLSHSSATNSDMGGSCSAQATRACSLSDGGSSTYSGSGSDEILTSRSDCNNSDTQEGNSFRHSCDGSTAVPAVQPSSEAFISDRQLVKSRKEACESHLAAFRCNRFDANAYDTSYGWSSERSSVELGPQIGHDIAFYRRDSTSRHDHEFTQYLIPRVHEGQVVKSFFDSSAGYPSQHRKRTILELPRQTLAYEHSFRSSSCTDIYTRTRGTAHDSHKIFDISGDASADAESSDGDFSKDRLRKVLLEYLLRDRACMKDHLKGWNSDTACIVTLGIMENFARQGNVYLTEKCAELMLHFGPSPMFARAFNIMIAACMKDANVSVALRWWSRFTSLGVQPTLITYNGMINLYARCRDLGQAEWWMERMLSDGIQPCLKSFTTLIVACGQSGSEREAEYWFQKMHAYGLGGDAVLYNAMIDTCAKVGNVAKAEMWFREMQAKGVTPVPRTFNVLIHACAKSGDMYGAEQWRMRMQEAGLRCDEYTYGSLIEACAYSHDMSLAEHLVGRMLSERLKPNLVILRSLSKVYSSHDGDRLARVLGLCMRDGGASPDDVSKALKTRGERCKSRALGKLLAAISGTKRADGLPRGQGEDADVFFAN